MVRRSNQLSKMCITLVNCLFEPFQQFNYQKTEAHGSCCSNSWSIMCGDPCSLSRRCRGRILQNVSNVVQQLDRSIALIQLSNQQKKSLNQNPKEPTKSILRVMPRRETNSPNHNHRKIHKASTSMRRRVYHKRPLKNTPLISNPRRRHQQRPSNQRSLPKRSKQ